jgi:hypothetical protein
MRDLERDVLQGPELLISGPTSSQNCCLDIPVPLVVETKVLPHTLDVNSKIRHTAVIPRITDLE